MDTFSIQTLGRPHIQSPIGSGARLLSQHDSARPIQQLSIQLSVGNGIYRIGHIALQVLRSRSPREDGRTNGCGTEVSLGVWGVHYLDISVWQ